ncbi:MAG: DsbA family protein [Proteobacteria bacterium]|nr:DsbA family protein [Pseudomonadota bacterium]
MPDHPDSLNCRMPKTLLYFADPMCSWCWGFEPAMARIRELAAGKAQVQLFLGGLRPFTEKAMTEHSKAATREHWGHVHEASGQPFDFAFFERDGFVYDTEPPCRAVVAVRRLDPELAFPMLTHLHRAFYALNRDITDTETLTELAGEIGIPATDFQISFDDKATKEETLADFAYTHRTDIGGFPTLIGVADGKAALLTMGYQPFDNLKAPLAAWLDT